MTCLSKSKRLTAGLTLVSKLVGEVVKDMEENGEKVPEPIAGKSYSGKFQVRIPPQQHRNLAIQAAEQGISLNRMVSSKLAS